jgi:hypothetical protein
MCFSVNGGPVNDHNDDERQSLLASTVLSVDDDDENVTKANDKQQKYGSAVGQAVNGKKPRVAKATGSLVTQPEVMQS